MVLGMLLGPGGVAEHRLALYHYAGHVGQLHCNVGLLDCLPVSWKFLPLIAHKISWAQHSIKNNAGSIHNSTTLPLPV